jgi:hypothetical protein
MLLIGSTTPIIYIEPLLCHVKSLSYTESGANHQNRAVHRGGDRYLPDYLVAHLSPPTAGALFAQDFQHSLLHAFGAIGDLMLRDRREL